MRSYVFVGLLVLSVSAEAELPCQKVINMQGKSPDLSCPDGPPGYSLGTLYESDDEGDWSGGQAHNCQWPGTTYSYVNLMDAEGTCYLVTESSNQNFGHNFHGVCLGTYYATQNNSYKNLGNVGYGPGDGFASSELGDDCFGPPGNASSFCSEANESSCFAYVMENCHVHIDQGAHTIVCPTAGTGD